MKLKHLLIFLSIIIFITLPIKSDVIFTEKETTEFQVADILKYGDNTIVLQIVRNLSGGNCSETKISFRVIYRNGTIIPIDLPMEELGIQYFNFCTVDGFNPISLKAIETKKGNFIVVTYTVAADVNNPFTYNDYLMLIGLNGTIYSKTLMGPSLIDSSNNNTWRPQQSFIYPNVNNEQGFLYFAPLSSGLNDVNNGIFSKITDMVLVFQVQPSVVSTVDGGYMFIYPNITTSQDPYSSQSGLYAMYCGYGSNITREPVILYETIMTLDIINLNCVISYSEVGQICLITIQPNSTDPNPIPVYIQVKYLSLGSVFDVKHVYATLPTIIGINQLTDPQFMITPLPFGGYFYSVVQTTNISSDIWGFVLDENGKFNPWNLSYPTLSDSNASRQILTNNTLVMLKPIVGQNWSIITTDLYKIHEDYGYGNIFISNTTPAIYDSIPARETNPLKITYTIPIVLSNGTITIFQSNGSSNPGIVRQTINGLNQKYVTFNNNTVSIDIIESTFNIPDTTYYVMIENNFVSSLLYNEPLPGLSSNIIWSFTTLPEEEKEKEKGGGSKIKMFFDGIYGKVKLTETGTAYFDTLNPDQIIKFFDNLTKELTDAVTAVTSTRITTNYRFVIDTSNIESSSKQYLLSIRIDKPKSASERETTFIIGDLKAMIQNMNITVLASGSSSKYLEPLYGYVTIPRWYENPVNIFELILTVIFFFILTILCIISIYYDAKKVNSDANSNGSVRKAFFQIMKSDICKLIKLIQSVNLCKGKEGNEGREVNEESEDKSNHFKIYLYGFNVLSFVLDILFAKVEAGSVKIIFFVSVFFVTVPYVIKLGYVVYIILSELVREENSEDSDQLLGGQQDGSQGQQDGTQGQQDDTQGQQDGTQGQQQQEKVTIRKWLEDSKDHKIVLVMLISLAGTDVGVYFLSKAIDFSYLSILTPLVSLIKVLSIFINCTKLMKTKDDDS
ncbi:6542_t:CDS:2 [Rhizophagus irregularis]|nr:6542_t:CDS:2 [Rhizophagus irregularis]